MSGRVISGTAVQSPVGQWPIRVTRERNATDVFGALSDLFMLLPPARATGIRPKRHRLGGRGQGCSGLVRSRGGQVESFNARLRGEPKNDEIDYALRNAQIVIESCSPSVIVPITRRVTETTPTPKIPSRSWAPDPQDRDPDGTEANPAPSTNRTRQIRLRNSIRNNLPD